MSSLPYPGRYESHASWDFRCRQWESNRRRSNSYLKAQLANYGGYNYHPVEKNRFYVVPEGDTVFALWLGKGNSHKKGAIAFARRNPGTEVYRVYWPGNAFTSRTDWIVVKSGDPVPGCEKINLMNV